VHELDSISELKNIAVESTIIQYGCDKLFEDSSIENRVVNINPSAKWIGELAHQNYAKWIIEKPYKLVPNYVSPFKIG
jgi:hypothetical protein